MAFLPISREEMLERDWDRPDIIVVSGDAYVDHPSFGTAIVSRVLESAGFRVCILPQPQNDADYSRFGTPRLAFFVNGGNIDPMVSHFTVAKRRRTKDYYSPGGVMGLRPDRATVTYCRNIRRIFGDISLCIGGLEASLRRFAHYDYWEDRVMPSILVDSGADLLMFGMGEKQIVEIAKLLDSGTHASEIDHVKGTCYLRSSDAFFPKQCIVCPSFEEVKAKTEEGFRCYAESCRIQQEEHDAVRGKKLCQKHGNSYLVQNPPMPPLSTAELDAVYELPFERNYHPSYEKLGGIPGIEEVKFSITHNRGCFGACNFCSIAFHQGRQITCRSHESVLREAKRITQMPDFKGYIHDVGGPTANFRRPSCELQKKNGLCKSKKCLAPKPCPNLEVDHEDYLLLLQELRKIQKIKKVFIRSGIRFDYLIYDKNEAFFKELVRYHVSGQLKVAPEHCSSPVLNAMGKPDISVYNRFKERFYQLTKSAGMKQYLVPYLMSSHPGSTLNDAIELALFLKKEGLHPEQVQDFYPTPGTVSTCMYYTGLDPISMKKIYVAKSKSEKAMQRALLQYFRPENKKIIMDALKSCGREDLIGFGKDCLVTPFSQKNPGGASPFSHGAKEGANLKPKKRKTSLSKHLGKKKKK